MGRNYEIMQNVRIKIAEYLDETQLSFAEFANNLGVSKSTAWQMINGKRDNPKLLTLIKISNVLDIPLIELMFNKYEDNTKCIKM